MQGSPTSGPWTVAAQGLLGAQPQETSGGQASSTSFVFSAAPHNLHYLLSAAFCQVSSVIKFS